MRMTAAVVAAALMIAPAVAAADPVQEAHAELDGWSAGFTLRRLDAVMSSYWPDATLFGTAKGDLARGTAEIRRHYAGLIAQGVQTRIGRRETIPLGPDAVLIAGYYEFLRMRDGKPESTPARFTILFTRRGAKWGIAHHHSSPYAPGAQ